MWMSTTIRKNEVTNGQEHARGGGEEAEDTGDGIDVFEFVGLVEY